MNHVASISQDIFTFLVIILSIILHEIAHGYAAYTQGDQTAYRAGRLTLNPLPHIDLMGSILIPFVAFLTAGTFFGWAKPVPYNPHNIKSNAGLAFVAAAGILTNLLIALAAGVIFKILLIEGFAGQFVGEAIITIIMVNVSLAFFNLIPIPPFDGMSILQALFPRLLISNRIVYNPFYMVGAVIVASVLYGMFMPSVYSIISTFLL